jgi:hypothetical protein
MEFRFAKVRPRKRAKPSTPQKPNPQKPPNCCMIYARYGCVCWDCASIKMVDDQIGRAVLMAWSRWREMEIKGKCHATYQH